MATPLFDAEAMQRIMAQVHASIDDQLLHAMTAGSPALIFTQQRPMPQDDPSLQDVQAQTITRLESQVAHLQLLLQHQKRETSRLRTEVRGLHVLLTNERHRSKPVPSDALLLDLIKLAHPDKWQNKPATELAHELMTRLNALRENG